MEKMNEYKKVMAGNKVVADLLTIEQANALTGTPKQVAWAESLRHEFVCKAVSEAVYEVEYGVIKPYLAWLIQGETTAKWWINHRFDTRGVMRTTMTAYRAWCQANDPTTWGEIVNIYQQVKEAAQNV